MRADSTLNCELYPRRKPSVGEDVALNSVLRRSAHAGPGEVSLNTDREKGFL